MKCIKNNCTYYSENHEGEPECYFMNEFWEICQGFCELEGNIKQSEDELKIAKEQLRLLRTINKNLNKRRVIR